jgi:outer membrane protein assembly factor BamD (BamD/ComL family)
MSAAISTANFLPNNSNPPHNNVRFGEDIRQLGQDLQSGDLSAAQQDLTSLQQDGSSGSASASHSNNPVSQAFNQLSVDLQSGNLAGAQEANTNIDQDFPNASQGQSESLHRFINGSGGTSQANPLFLELGQELQNGTLSTAQQSYNALTPDASFGQVATAESSNALSLSI